MSQVAAAVSGAVVLVVDDDADMRESLAQSLNAAGYVAHAAPNGEEALRLLRGDVVPAAILLDLFMPVMNGWQFVQRLRGTRYDTIPIVMVTGSEPYWGTPVARVLRKPLDMNQVLVTLADIIEGKPGATA